MRAEAAWQDPHCANDAEREEDVAIWKRSFDMPFEDTGTLLPLHTSSAGVKYNLWCQCFLLAPV